MNPGFSPEIQSIVDEQLATGQYGSADEVVLEAVRLLAERNRRLERLRREIQIGCDEIERGEYTDYDDASLKARFDELKQRAAEGIERTGRSP